MVGLTVHKGENNLTSCYQYTVDDMSGIKVMNIKFYDKFMDLIGREAFHTVGSRLNVIVGSTAQLTSF
jgi:hypothetical protein